MIDTNSPEEIETRAEQTDPIIMYLVVRESLNMSIGKTAAQVGHAAQLLTIKYFQHNENISSLGSDQYEIYLKNLEMFTIWLKTSFRKVVLKADEKEWEKLKVEYKDTLALVVDAGLTELQPNTETVIGLMPMYKSMAPKLVKRLQVLK